VYLQLALISFTHTNHLHVAINTKGSQIKHSQSVQRQNKDSHSRKWAKQVRPWHNKRFAKMGLETSVVCRFDTGPTFIDTDRPTCHPPECHHNQGVNLSSVIFAIFSSNHQSIKNEELQQAWSALGSAEQESRSVWTWNKYNRSPIMSPTQPCIKQEWDLDDVP